jgi:predicted transcriptional regulator
MGTTKTALFSEVENELAMAAKAFSHPARVAIIQYLLRTNACVNGDLVQELGLAQATISQHLKELKDIGIIQGTIEGARINYCIDAARWTQVEEQFNKLFAQYRTKDEDCC